MLNVVFTKSFKQIASVLNNTGKNILRITL